MFVISAPRLEVSAEASVGTASPEQGCHACHPIHHHDSAFHGRPPPRRAPRAAELEREIAEYRTDSERQDLYAMLSRHTAAEIAPIERILNQLARTEGLAYNR